LLQTVLKHRLMVLRKWGINRNFEVASLVDSSMMCPLWSGVFAQGKRSRADFRLGMAPELNSITLEKL
jgi:hypothetical protein